MWGEEAGLEVKDGMDDKFEAPVGHLEKYIDQQGRALGWRNRFCSLLRLYSFNKSLLRTYFFPDTTPGTMDAKMNKLRSCKRMTLPVRSQLLLQLIIASATEGPGSRHS